MKFEFQTWRLFDDIHIRSFFEMETGIVHLNYYQNGEYTNIYAPTAKPIPIMTTNKANMLHFISIIFSKTKAKIKFALWLL